MITAQIVMWIFIGLFIASTAVNILLLVLWLKSVGKREEADFESVKVMIHYKKLVSFLRAKKYNVEDILKGE